MSAVTIEQLQVLITANTEMLRKEIAQGSQTMRGFEKDVQGSGIKISSILKKVAAVAGAVAAAVLLIKKPLQAALDYIGKDTAYQATMGRWKEATRDFTEELKQQMGISRSEMRNFITTIYSMATAMGIGDETAFKLSKSISMLAQDMASFWGISTEDALSKLQSGLTGNAIALKSMGIVLTEATVKEVAYASGIAKTGENLTEQQKVLARYIAIMQQTGNMQGYMAATLESPNNQINMLKDAVKTASYTFGQLFIPVLQAVIPYLIAIARVATYAIEALAKLLGIKTGSSLTESLVNIGDSVGGVGSGIWDMDDALEEADGAAKKLKKTLAGFDEMNVLSDNAGGGGIGGGGGILDFDIPEYDFSFLDNLTSRADEITSLLKSKFESLQESMKKIWDSKPVQAFVTFAGNHLDRMKERAITLGTTITESWQQTFKDMEPDLRRLNSNLSELATSYFIKLDETAAEYSPKITQAYDDLYKSIHKDILDPSAKLFVKIAVDTSDNVLKTWEKHGDALLEEQAKHKLNTIEAAKDTQDKLITPIIQPTVEAYGNAWDGCYNRITERIMDFNARGQLLFLRFKNETLFPFLSDLKEKFAPGWEAMWKFIGHNFEAFLTVIGAGIDMMLDGFETILKFLEGDLVINWENAWTKIKDYFLNIWSAIGESVKKPINDIIRLLNLFFSNLKNVQIPDWVPGVGGKGINIPLIPYLASGGIIDRATLAVVGESGSEAVLPLENNTGWMDTLAERISLAISGGDSSMNLTIKLGEETILKKVVDGINDMSFQRNGAVVLA